MIKRSSPLRNCNFHWLCTVFGFHTLAPHELFAGLLPKVWGIAVFCGKMCRVFTYQNPCHNAPHLINATDLKPFENLSRVDLNPHRGKIGAEIVITPWVRNKLTDFIEFDTSFRHKHESKRG